MVVPSLKNVNKKHPLYRPTKVKKWSSDIFGIAKAQVDDPTFWADWDFQKGPLTKKDLLKSLDKMCNCGTLLEFRARIDKATGEAGKPSLYGGNYCKQSAICPVCASRVQDRRKVKFENPIKAASELYQNCYLVTATMKPSKTWSGGTRKMKKAFERFRKMGQKRSGGRSRGEFGKVLAGIAKTEFIRGAGSGLPHVHIHGLFFTNSLLDFRLSDNYTDVGEGKMVRLSKISEEWFNATDGEGYNIRVDVIKAKAKHLAKGMTKAESVFEQAREVLKYCTKFDSHPGKENERLQTRDLLDIKQASYGSRLFFTYGAFRNIQGDEYQGSDMPSYTHPAYYCSRYRGEKGYSELMPQNYPVFEDNDESLAVQRRVTIQNQYGGMARKLCGAIIKERDEVLLHGATISQNLIVNGKVFSVPQYLKDSPRDKNMWEKFVDQTKAILKQGRIELRETLLQQSSDFERYEAIYDAKVIGTEFRFRPAEYMDRIVKAFLEVLQHPLGYIPAPS